ncbi:FAD-dependent thymidylate synthase [Candidatus Igneacidithiobacillus taiwanensis]|uniref:FAD-dependent thymidylate synthase n=1 Tax=Candidatus Igneacidithiobacillus taiwanensis TaxID=1945924 RepID=UPI0028A12644|nr:FAD-dependent thymidylate synthase [Candidatus Igneacidithiobacillus taiwanensis]
MPVELLDHMGDDLTVVNAARVSMAKHSAQLVGKDEKLITYLAAHNHWTPFSHVTFRFRIKMPIFVAREWFRHTVGVTRNEVSRRYVTDEPEFFTPSEWRSKAEHVKQGSGGAIDAPGKLCEISDAYSKALEKCVDGYETLLNCGVCPEQARMILPQSMMTEFIETGSLYAYARIWRLRTDPHAQKEIQHYATQVGDAIEKLCPVSWAALTDWAKS